MPVPEGGMGLREAPHSRKGTNERLQNYYEGTTVCLACWDIPLQTLVPGVARRYGMAASMGRAVHKNAERWRWVLYVALAIVGALLTFVGARAQQKATDDATFRKLVD